MTTTSAQFLPREASPWPTLSHAFSADVDPTDLDGADINALVIGVYELDRGRSYLAWAQSRMLSELVERLVDNTTGINGSADGFADLAKRIARTRGMTQHRAEALLDEAVGVIGDLPETALALRDGVVTPEIMRVILQRTSLVHGRTTAPLVDADIARTLYQREGTWSAKTARDLADRVVFRHDRDAVREQRRRALDRRGVWTTYRGDGTGEIDATMPAENVAIAEKAIRGLANTACPGDPRTLRQRKSDAMYSLLSSTAFTCDCGRDDCTATIPEPGDGPDISIVVHVLADESTVDAALGSSGSDSAVESTTGSRDPSDAVRTGETRPHGSAGHADTEDEDGPSSHPWPRPARRNQGSAHGPNAAVSRPRSRGLPDRPGGHLARARRRSRTAPRGTYPPHPVSGRRP